jgi:hypothetical protein
VVLGTNCLKCVTTYKSRAAPDDAVNSFNPVPNWLFNERRLFCGLSVQASTSRPCIANSRDHDETSVLIRVQEARPCKKSSLGPKRRMNGMANCWRELDEVDLSVYR